MSTFDEKPSELVAQFAQLPHDRQAALLAISLLLDQTTPASSRSAQLAPCGTWAAYRRHRAHDEDPCEPCREASRRRDRARRVRRRRESEDATQPGADRARGDEG